MNNVRMPIKTISNGNKITKICVEDVYKILNRIQGAMDKAYNDSADIIDSVHKEYDGYEGELIIGTGTSQPCFTDAFDKEIGMNIAFMKAKLNANIKKYNILNRIYKKYLHLLKKLEEEMKEINFYINLDLDGIRKHNPDYLINKKVCNEV